MLVPEMLCGDRRTVTAACRKHITRFKRGEAWVDAGTMIDVRDASGLIMVGDPSPLLGGMNVRLYAPFWELDKLFVSGRATFESSIRAFDEALCYAWSTLGLLSQACYRWFLDSGRLERFPNIDSERSERFLQAIITHWPEIEAVGARYTTGLPIGEPLWKLPHKLKFVLAHRGVPQPRLVQPLPPGGIAALLPPKN